MAHYHRALKTAQKKLESLRKILEKHDSAENQSHIKYPRERQIILDAIHEWDRIVTSLIRNIAQQR
jgi:hypothetical protein